MQLQRYNNKVTTALIAFLLGLLTYPFVIGAETEEELRARIEAREDEIQKIEDEIEAYQKDLDETQEKAQTLGNEISILNTRIKRIDADIRLTSRNIEKSELTIETLNLEIDKKTTEITDHKASLSELIRTLHDAESDTLIEILLRHEQISDFFGDLNYISDLDAALQGSLDDLKALKSELEDERRATEGEQSRLKKLKGNYNSQRQIESGTRSQRSNLLKVTREDEARYQELLEEQKIARAEMLQEIAEIEAELQKLIDPSSIPSAGTSVLAWPILQPFLTQGYGYTEFANSSSDVYGGKGHNGVDFRARVGTEIFSSANGVVVETGNTDLSCPGGSYGKWILIEHPTNLATMYAHLSVINVSAGEEVTKGQHIGYSGDTGFTIGPHLHYTVYGANTVQFKPSRSGRCKRQPFGGPINPLDYLPSI